MTAQTTATDKAATAATLTAALVALDPRIEELINTVDGYEIAEDRIAEHARTQQVPRQDAARHANQIADALAEAGGHLRLAKAAIATARRRAALLVGVEHDASKGRH